MLQDGNGSCWVVREEKQLVSEEAPEAHWEACKGREDLLMKGCAERWKWCRERVSYMVRSLIVGSAVTVGAYGYQSRSPPN